MADDPWAEAYNRLRNEVSRATEVMTPDDIRSCVEDALDEVDDTCSGSDC